MTVSFPQIKDTTRYDEPAFCDQSYKNLRATVEFVKNFCKGLFHFFRCNSYSVRYYLGRCDEFNNYNAFGEHLINFSFNGLTEDRHLILKKWELQGYCYGMSLDFIRCYLAWTMAGKDPLLTVKKISKRYREGTTGSAFTISQLQANCLPDIKKISSEIITELGNRTRKGYLRIFSRKWNELRSKGVALDEIPSKVSEFLENGYYKKMNLHICRAIGKSRRIFEIYSQHIAQKVGIKIEKPQVFVYDSANHAASLKRFGKLVNKLKPGPYYVHTTTSENGHALALVKTKTPDHFIFDPNSATLKAASKKLASLFWKVVFPYFSESKLPYVNFYRCALLEDDDQSRNGKGEVAPITECCLK